MINYQGIRCNDFLIKLIIVKKMVISKSYLEDNNWYQRERDRNKNYNQFLIIKKLFGVRPPD